LSEKVPTRFAGGWGSWIQRPFEQRLVWTIAWLATFAEHTPHGAGILYVLRYPSNRSAVMIGRPQLHLRQNSITRAFPLVAIKPSAVKPSCAAHHDSYSCQPRARSPEIKRALPTLIHISLQTLRRATEANIHSSCKSQRHVVQPDPIAPSEADPICTHGHDDWHKRSETMLFLTSRDGYFFRITSRHITTAPHPQTANQTPCICSLLPSSVF
jgi:hypothetical protein